MAKVSLKKKKQLINKIIHDVRKYKFGIQRYGGETVVGTITTGRPESPNSQTISWGLTEQIMSRNTTCPKRPDLIEIFVT